MLNYLPKLETLQNALHDFSNDQKKCLVHLSYPFIPYFDKDFDLTKNKVLLIGQETKGWQGRLNNFLDNTISFENVIQNSKNRHKELYIQPPQRSKFLQFLAQIKQINNHEAIQWLNFYICDYEKKSFNNLSKKSQYKDIFHYLQELSILNLSEQIIRLKPKVIFFVGQYHNNFPTLEKKLSLSSNEKLLLKQPVDKFSMKIWNDDILVLRTPHPRHIYSASIKARQTALNYFKIFDECKNIDEFKDFITNDLK